MYSSAHNCMRRPTTIFIGPQLYVAAHNCTHWPAGICVGQGPTNTLIKCRHPAALMFIPAFGSPLVIQMMTQSITEASKKQ